MRDPYKILGVRRDAGVDEIKSAWRNMAKAIHPDRNQDDPTAAARFAEVGRAYETLKDPEKRNRFDDVLRMAEAKQRGQTIIQQRQAARDAAERAKVARANAERVMEELERANAQKAKQAQSPGQSQSQAAGPQKPTEANPQQQANAAAAQNRANPAESAEDMVERIFGAQARAASQATPERAPAGERIEENREEQTEASASGEANAAAPSGLASLIPLQPLSIISSLVRRITGSTPALEKAPDVIIEATVTIDDILKASSVTLELPEGREIRFNAAPGTTHGHSARLKGQGLRLQGLQRGDVVVNVRVAEHERFAVKGFDIHTSFPITIENAVLGCETMVEGPTGFVKLTVPAWSGSDHQVRIEGQGLPDGNGGKGDLVVELRLMLWEKPDDKVTDLMRSMREGLFL
ncbi:DnaJ C-terminal domain-containing protein [Rhizobium sp. BK251]|uniref:DnaJ C-terminal domain-containing protein n=1 Tax=Rhizobium sp. BK251 TaxID=2512125 RepID=UPI00104B9625|nr:DnaJ C-terminal domain-containing protein [Rhizobium sp. BK251]TCL75915.1 DnaJ-like protein [Rhizobium sp. BK251]